MKRELDRQGTPGGRKAVMGMAASGTALGGGAPRPVFHVHRLVWAALSRIGQRGQDRSRETSEEAATAMISSFGFRLCPQHTACFLAPSRPSANPY